MSHCISVYLINKSDLRDSNIDSILDNKKDEGIKLIWTELKEGILATTNVPNYKFGIDKTIAQISTDYFGGSGNQSSNVYENNKQILKEDDEYDINVSPINNALKLLGVIKKDGMDEFDTVELGRYRSNEDFN